MSEDAGASSRRDPAIPADDPARELVVADPEDPKLPHFAVVGGTYTILVSGEQTGGRYCLIDLLVPDGAGPPPHRHDFEELFTLLEGEIEFTFRGRSLVAKAGTTLNVPSNAPHSFKNKSGGPARLLCLCAPAGQDVYFAAIGGHLQPAAPALAADGAPAVALAA